MKVRRYLAGFFAAAFVGAIYAEYAIAAPSGVQAVRLDMNSLYIAWDYQLKADAKTHAIIQTFFDLKIPVIPLPKNIIDDRYDPSLNAIYWNSSAALQVADDSGKGTGKFISPALLLLDAMTHAIAHAQSAQGYANLEASPDPLFGTLEQRRVIAGLAQNDAHAKLHDQTQLAVADADKILTMLDWNSVENAVAAELGEPVRTNNKLALQDGEISENITYRTVDNPTWHN